jgi:hypothetical protein
MLTEIRVDQLAKMSVGRGASADELKAIDGHGFVMVPSLLSDGDVARLRAEFECLIDGDPLAAHHELGTRRTKAPNDNEVFAVCWRHRVALDVAAHLLGSIFEVGHVDLRDPRPRHGVQPFHPDHGRVPVPGLTATWFLDAFTVDNGATRVLPGSHRAPSQASAAGPVESVAGEVVIVGPPGSLLLRDARLLHAAGRNSTAGTRRSALVFYQHHIAVEE